jgi:hypothetical protein
MQVVVIVFGQWESLYREGLIAARTYKHLNPELDVCMVVEKPHCPAMIRMDMDSHGIRALEISARDLRFENRQFVDPLHIIQDWKIGIWHWVLTRHVKDACLLVDSDTVCIRPLNMPVAMLEKAREGKLLASLDIKACWENYLVDSTCSAYVPPEKRTRYINSGVLLASSATRDLFKLLFHRNVQGFFKIYTTGMRGDQPALNYLMNVEFPDRLELLGTEYNSIGGRQNDIARVKIVHWTGCKYHMPCHENLCRAILHGQEPRTYEELFPGIVSTEINLPRGL